MGLILNLIIGGGLILVTFIIQAICFDRIMKLIPWVEKKAVFLCKPIWKSLVFIVVISGISGAIIVEIWVWALFYHFLSVFPDLETALYFSSTSFTTVGYGDVVLPKEWRILSAVEAINGFLLFGWATAFIWEIVTHLYRKEADAIKG